MQHSRTYPYDHNANIATGPLPSQNTSNFSMSSQTYHRGSYAQQQNLGQYYVPSQSSMGAHDDSQSQGGQYVRATSSTSQTYQFPNDGGNTGYYEQSAAFASSSSPTSHYPPNRPYYVPSQYTSTQQQHVPQAGHSSRDNFIPTPSEIAHSYPSYSGQISPHQSSQPSDMSEFQQYRVSSSSRPSHSHPTHISTDSHKAPRTSTSPTSASSPTGERYPCEKCGKTFSRAHDRKRHHETQHLSTPVIHRCRFCEKEFSRADSLKRHLDNGCDERP